MADVAFPTGYERGLGLRALGQIRDRRRRLAAQATGRVLDLGGCVAHADLYGPQVTELVLHATDEADGERLARRVAASATPGSVGLLSVGALALAGERFDTVVSILQLSRSEDLDRMVEDLRTVLAPDGRLLFLEPTGVPGITGVAQHLLAPPTFLLTGRRPTHRIPAELRRGGLLVTDVDRFRLAVPWPYRAFVQGAARHPSASGGAADPDRSEDGAR